ncbi:hypothetical protein [Microbacterium sp. SORGH_AS_0888]|uniref:hypothetical protein n=1 Tax=Microbacterium sp. SORGH_AS_0888 TaxID=3041791 RepID=UPI00278A0811|nr:hypothetical protein [Microbacterium sp. SORGH_AS_0888]MDQ1131141.1 hypothetical protein [Microbacterium sp. SORGH_AS_0888]
MTRTTSSERLFLDPLTPNWTIADLLDWIAADDVRCHDTKLTVVLEAVDRALGAPAAAVAPSSPVALVRAIATRAAGDPTLGARRLGDLVAVPTLAPVVATVSSPRETAVPDDLASSAPAA